MGSITSSRPGFAVLQPSFRFGQTGKKKAIPLNFLGHHSSKCHWPKQQWRALHFFFLPPVTMCQHCSRCVVAQLVRPFSPPCVFHMLFCMFHTLFCMFHILFCVFHMLFCVFHVLVYSKSWMQLAGFSDRQRGCVCATWCHPKIPLGISFAVKGHQANQS